MFVQKAAEFVSGNLRKANRPTFQEKKSKSKVTSHSGLLVATGLSLMLHAAAPGIVGYINKFLHKQPQTQISALIEKELNELTEKELEETAEIERKLQLEKLKAEKKEFIQQLLLELHNEKRSISISDFAIKSEVLDRNIENMESGSGDIIDEKESHNRYEAILGQAKRWTDKYETNGKKIEEMHHFSHYRMFRGYLKGSGEILDVLEKGIYNCFSSTEFDTALEDDIVGSGNYGVVVLDPPKDPSKGKSGHMLSWFRDKKGRLWQIENTDGGPPRRVPFVKGLRTPKEIFIAAYLINNGIRVDQLPKKLAQLYKRGVRPDGFPIAGVSTDLPEPPDYLIPNPYFGIKNPKSFPRNIEDSTGQIIGTEEIIKEAKIDTMAFSFFREPKKLRPKTIGLSIIKIPEGIDWCNVAEEAIDFPGGYSWGGSLNSEFSTQPYATFSLLRRLRYLIAIRMAKNLSNSGDKRFETCTPKEEYIKFTEDVEEILRGGEEFNEDQKSFMAMRLLRGLSNTEKARKDLFKIINKFGTTQIIGEEAMALLAIIGSPEDFDFFAGELFENTGEYHNRVLPIFFSTYALLNMGYETKDLAKIFLSAIEKENHSVLRGLMITRLGKLGYGIKALTLLEQQVLPNLKYGAEDHEINDPLKYKRWITRHIPKLHPDIITNENIQTLKTMIEQENDFFTKVNLIVILANEGKKKESLEYLKKLNLSRLDDDYDDYDVEISLRKEFVSSLGKINSPEIEEMLVSILDAYPDLATVVGEVFVRQHFHSEKVIEELRRTLNNNLIDTLERKYAALLLVEMGEL